MAKPTSGSRKSAKGKPFNLRLLIGIISIVGVVVALLNDGWQLSDRIGFSGGTTKKITSIVVNTPGLILEDLSTAHMFFDSKQVKYSFEVESTGEDLLIQDGLEITKPSLDLGRVNDNFFNTPALVNHYEVEDKYINSFRPRTKITLFLTVRISLKKSYVALPQSDLFGIGHFDILVPFKDKEGLKVVSQRVDLLARI